MKKEHKTPSEQSDPRMPLTRRNYILLAVGFAVILLGFILMAMFSWRRITLAPILVVGGFVIEIFAIMKRFRNE